jgi:nicotinate phosphoribosyltransferase
VTSPSPALLTDLYELTMLAAYFEERMEATAVFSLFVRRLPERRNYLLACGVDAVLSFLEAMHFDQPALEYLESLRRFSPAFLRWLEDFRFTGDVSAVPEGTPLFAREPILEVSAPIGQGQLAETFVMNQVHLQTLMASKAARVVQAAQGRPVVDFGVRRMHGIDAGLKAPRAFYIAGVSATSHVAAGQLYGLPLSGTLAHSYIQAHDDEYEAFRSFARVHPDTVLLVDTYDSRQGVAKVVQLARELGPDFHVSAVRLDSGDLLEESIAARRILDDAGLTNVAIVASGNLNEDEIARLVAAGAPIASFGVGTEMGISRDVPAIDIVYKLVEYGGRGRVKLSPGKEVLPGRKQIFRIERDGLAEGDVIGRHDESLAGRPLLRPVMKNGVRLPAGVVTLADTRAHAVAEMERLPPHIRALEPARPPHQVDVSAALEADAERVRRDYAVGSGL